MQRYHPQLELAPRDVVARAITQEGFAPGGGAPLPVYLDMRHVTGIDLTARFPGISWFLRQNGLALKLDLIPVRPAAHYLMGGVRADIDGRTSLPRLYAAGEAACTGVHGANRLASNSLLEGLVFGARAAKFMLEESEIAPGVDGRDLAPGLHSGALVDAQRARLQSLMWRQAGLLRDRDGLRSAAGELAEIGERLPVALERPAIELKNLHSVASLIVEAAVGREESRGAHFRNDFPRRDDLHYRKHSVIREGKLSWADFSSAPAAPAERPAGKPQPQSPQSPR